MPKEKILKRKKFIQTTATVGLGTTLMPKMAFAEFSKKPSISIGFIGTGLRGQWLIDLAAKRDDVHIPAICDIDEAMIKNTIKILQNNKKDLPEVYNKGEYDYQNLINDCP